MRGRVFLGVVVVAFFSLSCEDPVNLSVSKAFGNNNLVTAYIDTFSVVTSTIQLDTLPTNNASAPGVLMLGEYKDPVLGSVTSSPYFMLGYNVSTIFKPDVRNTFDSMVLILPYNKQFYGDTAQSVTFSVHQLTEPLKVRTPPYGYDIKISVINNVNGFFSSSESPYDPAPIVSKTTVFRPHNDSLIVRLPDSYGLSWFTRAQYPEADPDHVFSDLNNFFTKFLLGLHLKVSPAGGGSLVGFNASKIKFRIYYKQLVNDIQKQYHYDFPMQNVRFAFQNIKYDRSGTIVDGLQARQAIPSATTGHVTFVQAGTGLATRLDFPSFRTFFSDKRNILNAAYLEIYPVQGTYPRNLAPPTQLYLYTTDQSNIPLNSIYYGAAGALSYDREFNIHTLYSFSLFNYFQQQLTIPNINPVPLILAPESSQVGSSVQRVIIGDRFHPTSKIKLKIFYSYAPN